jgi:uncharacterized phage protein (TIGR02218 family)
MALSRSSSTDPTWKATTKRLARLFRITRTDGVVLRFTDHNGQLVYNGETFDPAGGIDGSARRYQHSLRAASMEFRGIISSAQIAEDDLRAGLYREAQIEEIEVDWRYPWRGAVTYRVWWLDATAFDEEIWTGEISGPQRFTDRQIGEVFDRTCERDLGDDLCGVNIASLVVAGVTVLFVEDGAKRLTVRADPGTIAPFSDGYFAYGELLWQTGANAGLRGNVKAYRSADRRIELQAPAPRDIAAGDTFDLYPGCDKLLGTCRDRFANVENFGGWPYIPGADRVLQTPPRR